VNKKEDLWQKISPDMFDETIETVTHYTKDIAKFIEETKYNDLSDEVIKDTKMLILDTIGCALAGINVQSSKISRKTVEEYLGGKTQSTVIGTAIKTSSPIAALANAKSANAIDLDDCFMNVAHFAPQVIMAPLGIGELFKKSGKEYLLSVTLGYEIAARIALSANFWKVTAGLILGADTQRLVFGANVFGAAVSTGKILNFNEEELLNTLGVCGYFAPSLIRSSESALEPPFYSDSGYMAKYCDAGWSTFTGVMSALYAKNKFIANHHVFDGKCGYIKLMGGQSANPSLLTNNLSNNQEHWYIQDSALKKYPCCKYIQNPIHLFLDIIEENNIKIDDIEKIIVHFRPFHALRFGEQDIQIIKNIPCTHNIPYNLTMAALKISPNSKWHAKENTENSKVKQLMKKIFTVPSGEALVIGVEDIKKCGFPKRIFSRVDIFYKGKIYSKSNDRVKGDPWWKETKFTDNDLKNKFETCAEGILDNKKISQVIDKIMNLEEIEDISEITELLIKKER